MKVLWATPLYCSVQGIFHSLEANSALTVKHWVINLKEQNPYPEDFSPDVILYMGHINSNDLEIAELKKLRKKARIVNIITHGNDAGCQPWYQKYHDEDVFTLQVSVDGGNNWPKRNQDYTTLPPINPNIFPKWQEKTVLCGYTHEWNDSWRQRLFLQFSDYVTQAPRNHTFGYYQDFVNFMSTCKNWVHLGFSKDSISQKMIETAYAGCNLIEMADNRGMMKYFTPFIDYTPFRDVSDVPGILVSNKCTHLAMREKIDKKYSAKIFWKNLFTRVFECAS